MLSFLKRNKVTPPVESNISSLAHSNNEYFAQDLIQLNEPLTANLYCAGQTVIEVDARLMGNIISKSCTVCGKVKGNLTAVESIVIKETANIAGDIKAPAIDIEPGAVINGKVMVATDIYAMVALTEKLKNNLHASVLPAKLNIAASAIALSTRTDEPIKPLEQKANISKPAAAALPVAKPEPVMTAPATVKSKPAAAPAVKPEPEDTAPTVVKSKPAAAASPMQNTNAGEASGKWW